jgi:hypothetical protein
MQGRTPPAILPSAILNLADGRHFNESQITRNSGYKAAIFNSMLMLCTIT